MNPTIMTFDEALAECERQGLRPIQGGVVAAVVVAVVAALASAYATYSASQAQAAQAEYAGKVAKEQAKAAAEAGKLQEENQREQDTRMRAALRAKIGATGADETIGAPLLAEMESAANAEKNARAIRWSAETRTQGFMAEAVGQQFAAKQYRRQGYVGAGAALLTGAAKAYAGYESARAGAGGGQGSYSYTAGSDYYSNRGGRD